MNIFWKLIFKRKKSKGFEKVKEKLSKIGFEKKFKTFNIVGTNGKGSVCQYLTDSFIASGKKVGTFTSPHIFLPNERIKINNKNISNKTFKKLSKGLKGFSFFETFLIVAMRWFQENKIDIAFMEAGIGGEKDITKCIESDFAVVTSIDIDHEKILGFKKIEIAKQKDGIRSKHTLMFVPTFLDDEVKDIFLHDNFLIIKNNFPTYQKRNIALAKGICKYFDIKLISNQILGRTQIVKKNGFNAILDVAHNIAGFEESLKLLKDKNIFFDKVILCINKNKSIKNIKKLFKDKEIFIYKLNKEYYSGKDLEIKEITNIQKTFNEQNCNTLYIGSFKLIGEIYENEKSIIFE